MFSSPLWCGCDFIVSLACSAQVGFLRAALYVILATLLWWGFCVWEGSRSGLPACGCCLAGCARAKKKGPAFAGPGVLFACPVLAGRPLLCDVGVDPDLGYDCGFAGFHGFPSRRCDVVVLGQPGVFYWPFGVSLSVLGCYCGGVELVALVAAAAFAEYNHVLDTSSEQWCVLRCHEVVDVPVVVVDRL